MAAAWGVLLICGIVGLFRPLDDLLRDQRFGAVVRPATGDTVFVDIDSASLKAIGVWPWPRHVYADLLDAVMEAGAIETVFDIDFSAASTAAEDERFKEALDAAGGYAFLAAFRQRGAEGGPVSYNLPLEGFRESADPLVVNVALDPGGIVRSSPYAVSLGGKTLPSAASQLSHVRGPADTGFFLDFSIDAATIDRIPANELLAGTIDPARIADKQVIIGSSALELRDFFVVPRQGLLPGAVLQILATETLRQNRALAPAFWPPTLVAVLIGILTLAFGGRVAISRAIIASLAVMALSELMALVLQTQFAVLFDTAIIHLSAGIFLLGAVAREIETRGRLHAKAARERDATRRTLDQVIADHFDGVVVVEESGRIAATSKLAELTLGAGLIGQQADDLLPPELAAELRAVLSTPAAGSQHKPREFVLRRGTNEQILEYVITRSVIDGPEVANVACLTFRDITERRRNVDRLRYLGSHDSLTGALSRTRFIEKIDELLASESGRAAGLGIVAVDLRRFRAINDTLGHTHGDALLKQVVSRLRGMGPDAVARLGGDSFVVLVPEANAERLRGLCESVTMWLSFPYELEGKHKAVIAASAGATTSVLSGYDPEVLLSHADMALSAAKQIAGNGVMIYEPVMDHRLKQKQAMDAALRQALERKEFHVAYQPLVDIESGDVVGVEALARWTHPELGPISPAQFIPAAEETGGIIALGQWALETACHDIVGLPVAVELAVNISPVQLELTDIASVVMAALRKAGLAPERLTVEITEGIFVGNAARVTSQLQTLRDAGVKVALDDFGTGYSSLSYLKQLPIDKIKIDQSFVKRLPGDKEAAAIIGAVMTLSEALGKTVVAEGLETADQVWMLRMMHCKVGQGYYFGRPQGIEQTRDLLLASKNAELARPLELVAARA